MKVKDKDALEVSNRWILGSHFFLNLPSGLLYWVVPPLKLNYRNLSSVQPPDISS